MGLALYQSSHGYSRARSESATGRQFKAQKLSGGMLNLFRNRTVRLLILLCLTSVGLLFRRSIPRWLSNIDAGVADIRLSDDLRAYRLRFACLEELNAPSDLSEPGPWLQHQAEPGQTFAQYVLGRPNVLDKERPALCIQPLCDSVDGRNDEADRQAALVRDFLSRYFCCEVRLMPSLPVSVVPDTAQRIHPHTGRLQLNAQVILDDVLPGHVPEDAAALLALTTTDLWPGRNWNFVFGLASLDARVGVWSTARFAESAPDSSDTSDDSVQFLRRLLRTSSHETAHMLSMRHCVRYECNMRGAAGLEESDRYPLWLCPECTAKLCYATGADPVARMQGLAEFCGANGLHAESCYYRDAAAALRQVHTQRNRIDRPVPTK